MGMQIIAMPGAHVAEVIVLIGAVIPIDVRLRHAGHIQYIGIADRFRGKDRILLRCRGRKSAAWNCARNKCGTQEHCKCRTVQFFHETSFLSKCFDLRESLGPQQALGAGAAPLPAGGGRDRLDGLPSFERFPK